LINNNQNLKNLQKAKISKKIALILNALGYDDHEISIVFTDNAEITELNKTFRGLSKPTNVLSFPMLENIDNGADYQIISPEINLLGDIVISVETALEEALDGKITLNQRISQLLVHGILHLIGHDHTQGEEEFLKMEQKSLELLKIIEDDKNLNAF
jgi:probable rRNA maturation factor